MDDKAVGEARQVNALGYLGGWKFSLAKDRENMLAFYEHFSYRCPVIKQGLGILAWKLMKR